MSSNARRAMRLSIVLITFALTFVTARVNAAEGIRLQPSETPAYIPSVEDTFAEYVLENTRRIDAALRVLTAQDSAPFVGNYTVQEVVAMRAPYEIEPDASRCTDAGAQNTGFLLIHGLTDSPYLLRPVADALASQYPCALLRGVLLPGHGTQPGDSLEMRYEQWQQVTRFGIESFRTEVDKLFLVGYSTGSSLSLDYAAAKNDDPLIAGLILFSPALRARSDTAGLAVVLRWFKRWLNVDADTDAVKYESFSINAGAEFYQLTRTLDEVTVDHLPVFMAISGDDETIEAEAAREFFCENTNPSTRRMLWYQAEATRKAPLAMCTGIQLLAGEDTATRSLNMAHTGITVPPDDAHYGVDARYRNCLHYAENSANRLQCLTDNLATVYGERNLLDTNNLRGMLLRRATFNPHFADMMQAVYCIIDKNCDA